MKLTVETDSQSYRVDLEAGRSIAISLDFDGDQPNHFGVPRASSSTVTVGDFVGDTRRGGSCNLRHLSLIPHCHGTHTESIGHIVNDRVDVGELLQPAWLTAQLTTVTPVAAADCRESYRPPLDHDDLVITSSSLLPNLARPQPALIVRTSTHQHDKRSVAYGTDYQPAFMTVEAMQAVVDAGIEHLLVDLPSVDRMYDEGLLTNHHLFWNVPEGTHELTDQTHRHKTITEMIYVPDDIKDGMYLLNLQIPDFQTDAAPSRPMLFPVA